MIGFIRSSKSVLAFVGLLILVGSFTPALSQTPDPHQVPVMDGEAGPCSVAFTVTDVKGAPVYAARIKVHIEYGFAGVRRLDLEAATNVDGKTQFKGLPQKVKGKILNFLASQGTREGSAVYDPATNCTGVSSSIVLSENR
jgi:hypothetical protein